MRKLLTTQLLLATLLAGCNTCPEKVPPYTSQEFTGREELIDERVCVRRPCYRAKVPIGWVRIDPEGSLHDTREPNVTFLVDRGLKVTVHTFPSDRIEARIPPFAQVERWREQAAGTPTSVEAVSHGGFAGLCFESPTILAWSMQLDLEHYQTLNFLAHSPSEVEHFKQMRADYTIKAVGPSQLIEKRREELYLFAKSFELIQEIPGRW